MNNSFQRDSIKRWIKNSEGVWINEPTITGEQPLMTEEDPSLLNHFEKNPIEEQLMLVKEQID
jgi:hypothetical protein